MSIFFCSLVASVNDSGSNTLSGFIQQWKQWTSKRIKREIYTSNYASPIWQKEYFDHLLRLEESYLQKLEYVKQNPVRKGLIQRVEDWKWQGEIYDLAIKS